MSTRITVEVDLPCPAVRAFAEIDDLDDYPRWMGLVHAAAREDSAEAWAVELRGRIGPFARSKKLRMVRTGFRSPNSVRFERREVDGRDHGSWVLDAEVHDTHGGCRLTVSLDYGGRLWSGVVEKALNDEIERSKERLRGLVSG